MRKVNITIFNAIFSKIPFKGKFKGITGVTISEPQCKDGIADLQRYPWNLYLIKISHFAEKLKMKINRLKTQKT